MLRSLFPPCIIYLRCISAMPISTISTQMTIQRNLQLCSWIWIDPRCWLQDFIYAGKGQFVVVHIHRKYFSCKHQWVQLCITYLVWPLCPMAMSEHQVSLSQICRLVFCYISFNRRWAISYRMDICKCESKWNCAGGRRREDKECFTEGVRKILLLDRILSTKQFMQKGRIREDMHSAVIFRNGA